VMGSFGDGAVVPEPLMGIGGDGGQVAPLAMVTRKGVESRARAHGRSQGSASRRGHADAVRP
jgi:hypothetical protein